MLLHRHRHTSPKNDQLKFLRRWQVVQESTIHNPTESYNSYHRNDRIIDAYMGGRVISSKTLYNFDYDHPSNFNPLKRYSLFSPEILNDIMKMRHSQLGHGDVKNEVPKTHPQIVNDKAQGSIIMKNTNDEEDEDSEPCEESNSIKEDTIILEDEEELEQKDELQEIEDPKIPKLLYVTKPSKKRSRSKNGLTYQAEIKKRRIELKKIKRMKERIYVCGRGITEAQTEHWNTFMVIVDGIGSGKLSVAIEGPSKAVIKLNVSGSGQYEVDYRVSNPGFYICIVTINKEPIKLSPLLLIVKSETVNLSKPMIFSLLESIGINFEPISTKKVKVITSMIMSEFTKRKQDKFKAYCKGLKNSCKEITCKYNSTNKIITVIFIANKTGKHEINVTLKQFNVTTEVPMLHNPLPIWVQFNTKDISNNVVSHSNKHKIKSMCCYGIGLSYAFTDRINYVFVERPDRDYSKVNLQLHGPSHPSIYKKFTNNGLFFSYRPTIPGIYTINIFNSDKEVLGSPFMIRVFKNHSECIESPLTNSKFLCCGKGLFQPKVDEWNHFEIQIVKYPWKLEKIEIHSTESIVEHVRMNQLKPSVYLISFFPIDTGVHTIVFIFPNKAEENAPFYINVA